MKRTRKTKPENVRWTDSQWEAISGSGADTLVAAAAGSGKTAVLVERVIQKIINEENGIDIDRLLIVTFTNAAAAEMKTRIGKALEREIHENPGSLHLRRQLSLLNKAQISSLHSFCMSVIRRHYFQVELDPKFRVLDETEGEWIKEEILEQILEEKYEQPESSFFIQAADSYSGSRNDERLRQLIRRLYDFSRAHPDPSSWLGEMSSQYETLSGDNINEHPWSREIIQEIHITLEGALRMLYRAEELAHAPSGPLPYAEAIQSDIEQLSIIKDYTTLEQLYAGVHAVSSKGLKPITKKHEVDESLKVEAKQLRDKSKDILKNIKELLYQSPEKMLEDMHFMVPAVKELTTAAKELNSRFTESKRDKGVADFSDLEHLTLQILRDQSGSVQASAYYQDHFQEVLVDEYQDTNYVQEAILQLVAAPDRLFMVGDVKQSIYRFRLAEPGLFIDKYERYTTEDSENGWKINLDKNFRSRRNVIDASNFIFKQLMDKDIGGIAYDREAALKQGNEGFQSEEDPSADIAVINRGTPLSGTEVDESQEDTEKAVLEARYIAGRIQQMMDAKKQIIDDRTGEPRPVRYSDFVILMRSMAWSTAMMEEFRELQIPVYAELRTGYFKAVEIHIILSLLHVIDNPIQDIPLASVLRSPIGQFSEEDMAEIRMADTGGTYYDALLAASETATCREKIHSFLVTLEEWRTYSRQESLPEFIWRLLQESGYYDFAGGLPGGKQRQANLLALYDRARAYEQTSFRGLFRFLRFVERLQEKGDDMGTARTLGEKEEVVRLMTIHKSKGLEFPVVFLSGLSKDFNMRDMYSDILLHQNLGIGTKYINPSKRIVKTSLPQAAIKIREKKELLAEEMRVLYVGLTRAKEQFILVGTVKDAASEFSKWAVTAGQAADTLSAFDRLQAKTFFDWIMPAVLRHADHAEWQESSRMDFLSDTSSWNVEVVEQHTLTGEKEEPEQVNQKEKEALIHLETVPGYTQENEEVGARMNWEYPYAHTVVLRSKQTVSEWKQAISDPYSEQPALQTGFRSAGAERPRFLQEKTVTPQERGTAFHIVMEHVSLEGSVTTADLTELKKRLVAGNWLTEEQAEVIDENKIQPFFESRLGKELMESADVWREVAFTYGRPVPEGDGDITVLQGMADCVFRNSEGRLVLIDYKTDRLSNVENKTQEEHIAGMKEKYQFQLDVYREALSAIWEEPVQEAYIYAFDQELVIPMNKEGARYE
ncbi:DNA helicase/exodeoxyribonuclease V subunit A [Sinobaca qinghaiensis]|uniref:ATP-dependent helicase/nuclease subunit A n=1 Tax=Sinobaca qinghaiensis TaxID=342944 RepID=A0A419UXA4_9BACL|nr:helicase-exonuclease AddAB subunit AddA [Sinobaca qinghaiensis]RKD69768.1 DNA helicase/exodeoxyribonuclease V subunit A [Sinobaca qinghaiensis]